MTQLTTKQADNFLFALAKPIIDNLSTKVGYQVYVYYPGIDAPRVKNKQQIFIQYIRTTLEPTPLAIGDNTGQWVPGELRVVIHATEKQSDFNDCTAFIDEFIKTFSRRRCGYDIVIRNSYWEDTEPRDGRRLFTIVVNYEYEGF